MKINWIDKPLARFVLKDEPKPMRINFTDQSPRMWEIGQLFFVIKKYDTLAYVCCVEDTHMFWHVPIKNLDFQDK